MREKPRILIVDDEEINIQVMTGALKGEYEIDSALGGKQAILKVKECMPDLILLDMMMPDLSGAEVCTTIKAEKRLAHIPIIFLTALNTAEGEAKALEAGAIDYLNKPVNIDLIRLRVKNHIGLVRARDEICSQRDLLTSQKNDLEASISRNKHLEGLLPICMYCKQIRDDGNTWHQLEMYITEHSDALFSHGICPHCIEKKRDEFRKIKLEHPRPNHAEGDEEYLP